MQAVAPATTGAVAPSEHTTAQAQQQRPATWAPLPLPRYVQGQKHFTTRKFSISQHLPIPGLSDAVGATMPVQVLVTAHRSDWSPSSYVLSHGPSSSTKGPAAVQGGQLGPQAGGAAPAAVGDPGSTTLGPFSAVAVRRAQGVVCLKSFAHNGGLSAYLSTTQPFDVVLQEQVSTTSFHLHIKPRPSHQARPSTCTMSPAGGGMGLQIFPGSIQEVDCDLVLARSGCRVVVDVPRALMISQLLQDSALGFPMPITVTVLESAGASNGAATASAASPAQRTSSTTSSSTTTPSTLPGQLKQHKGSTCATFTAQPSSLPDGSPYLVGRHVTKMALSPDRHLTLHLGPQPAAPTNNNNSTQTALRSTAHLPHSPVAAAAGSPAKNHASLSLPPAAAAPQAAAGGSRKRPRSEGESNQQQQAVDEVTAAGHRGSPGESDGVTHRPTPPKQKRRRTQPAGMQQQHQHAAEASPPAGPQDFSPAAAATAAAATSAGGGGGIFIFANQVDHVTCNTALPSPSPLPPPLPPPRSSLAPVKLEDPGSDAAASPGTNTAAAAAAAAGPRPASSPQQQTPVSFRPAAGIKAEAAAGGEGGPAVPHRPGHQGGSSTPEAVRAAAGSGAHTTQGQGQQALQGSGAAGRTQQLLQQYLAHELRVKSFCAAEPSMVQALNDMSLIALRAIPGTAGVEPSQASQAQQQQQQQLQDFLAQEMRVKAYCATTSSNTSSSSSSSILQALNAMSAIALRAITQAG